MTGQLPIFEEEKVTIESLKLKASTCTECPLHCQKDGGLAFSSGHPFSPLMIVGEAPGAEEAKQGKPFAGRSGQLLDKALLSVNIKRENVYVTNICKHRPENNRTPTPEEQRICSRLFLHKEIELVKPLVILALGNPALKFFSTPSAGITRYRGKFLKYNNTLVMPTFHPSYILRNPSRDEGSPARLFWEDLRSVVSYIDQEGILLTH